MPDEMLALHTAELARLENMIGALASELRHELRNVTTENRLIRGLQDRDDIRISRVEKSALAQDEWNVNVMKILDGVQQWTVPDGFEATVRQVVIDAQRDAEDLRWKRIQRYWWLALIIAGLLAGMGPTLITRILGGS